MEVLLQSIFAFAANDVKTMLRCELTCKAFQQVVQQDKTWEHVPGIQQWDDDDRLTSNRAKACMSRAIECIRAEQNQGTNILVEELDGDVDECEGMATAACWHYMDDDDTYDHTFVFGGAVQSFVFRGDALFTLLELVQSYMIRDFQEAQMACIHFS